MFVEAFPDEPSPVQRTAVIRGLASFCSIDDLGAGALRSIRVRGDAAALSESAQRGLDLFTSERLECYHCHAVNLNFTGSFRVEGQDNIGAHVRERWAYNIGGTGAYPPLKSRADRVLEPPRSTREVPGAVAPQRRAFTAPVHARR